MDDKAYKLTVKQKAVGILIVCLFFVCFTLLCIKKERSTYEYSFKLNEMELKSAEYEDGVIRCRHGEGDYDAATKPFFLPAGKYTINITYNSNTDGVVLVQGNNDCVYNIDLENTGGELRTISDPRLILPMGTDRGKIKISVLSEGQVNIGNISISSPIHIYRDYYLYVFIVFIISAAIIVTICLFNRLNLTRSGWSYVGLFIITIIVVNIPFAFKGTYYEIDTQAHMKRIEAIAQGLRDGQFPVLVGPNYANQYGELVALQPGLFLYIPAFLRLLGISVPLAYDLYMALVNIVTAAVTFACAQRMFNTVRWGIIASVIYLIEPMRVYVMLGLGAGAGMGTALIFLPLIALGMHETMNKGGFRWKYIAVGLWGMACSHVLGFALGAITLVIYILWHGRRLFDKGVIPALIKAFLTFIVLSAGVLYPFIGYYFTQWNRAELAWNDFYHSPFDLRSEIFNLISLSVILISYFIIRRTAYLTKFGRGIFSIGIISVIISSSIFPWIIFKWIPPIDTFLTMMQYPFRFHLLAVPYVAYTGAEAICCMVDSKKKEYRKIVYAMGILLAIGLIINFKTCFTVKPLFTDPVTGEINTAMEDYLPEGTQTEWYATDTGDFSDYDKVAAYSYKKEYTHVDLTYTSGDDGQYMDFPLFYYDGYVAYDQDGNALTVCRGDKNRVRVYLTRSDDVQELHLRFEVKKSYRYVFILSFIIGTIWLVYNIGYLLLRTYRSRRVIV